VKLLIAIPCLPRAEKVIRFADQIAAHAEKPVHLLLVMDGKQRFLISLAEEVTKLAREILGNQEIYARLKIGEIEKEIIHAAKEGDYDLLILGDVPTRYLSKMMHGVRTAKVVKDVMCPVIVVKGMTRRIRRILLCDSGAGKSPLLSRYTAQLAKTLEGEEEVIVLHVMSQICAGPGVPDRDLLASVDELIELHTPEGEILSQDMRFLAQPGIHPIPLVRHGLVVDEILDEARRGDYDLIVIGAHQAKDWHRFLLEDFTRQILIYADRPVMVVP
jgi:nucleotide-binding universal stress UspA family protein